RHILTLHLWLRMSVNVLVRIVFAFLHIEIHLRDGRAASGTTMITVDLRALIGKLNTPCREALQAGIGLAVARSHYAVEVEHWLLKLLDQRDNDLAACLAHFQADRDQLATDLNRVLDRLKSGNNRDTPFSPQLVQLTRDAWLLASLSAQPGLIRS